MERDCYQVEVLYFLNPHLIWAEVKETSQQDFVFEQIGIYGILPFETTLDPEGNSLKGQRCKEWAGASSVLMKKAFFNAKQVFFRPTHIDRRTSIFDDNIHKYGELIIKTQDNKKLELSAHLVESGFAFYDICLFHQELSLGNLKTKLNYAETLEIIKHLEKDTRLSSKKQRQSSVKKQTTVFQAASDLGSVLTEQNLRKHNSYLSTQIDTIMEKKSKDFDRCKDIDDESLGRASYLRKSDAQKPKIENNAQNEERRVPLLLKKKLQLNKSPKADLNDPLQVLMATKQFLEANAKVIQSDGSRSGSTEPNHQALKKENNMEESGQEIHIHEESVKNLNVHEYCSKKVENIVGPQEKVGANDKVVLNKTDDSFMDDVKVKRTPNRRPKKYKPKMPEYDIATEKRVAYGPPGIDATCLHMKVVPKTLSDEEVTGLVSKREVDYGVPLKSQELYADVDSNVDLEISNKDVLNEKFKEMYSNVNDSSLVNDTSNISDKSLDQSNGVVHNNDIRNDCNKNEQCTNNTTPKLSVIQKKLKLFKEKRADSTVTSTSDTTNKDSSSDEIRPIKAYRADSDDEDISDLVDKINLEYKPKSIKAEIETRQKISKVTTVDVKNNVNPFKNIDSSLSVFVDKLVTPVLMVHNKMNYPIEPSSNIRDVNFNTHIHVVLKNLGVERPMMLQMVSWPVILRGYSLYMIGPQGSGKTFGYLPAVCRLITDDSRSEFVDSVGPSCIIVCATAQSVSEVEHYARMFLGVEEKVVACFAGVDELELTTSLLNGCNLFICTPSILVRLLQLTDFGIDLRRLATFVLEDSERLSEVYASEVKYFLIKIREMLRSRVNKELKVQFVVASRVWCDFMEPLAKRTPNSVVCIGAFQECVLYSKANTSVDFLKKENKLSAALDFLKEVDGTKKSIIVCRSNDEVQGLTKVLTKNKYTVFACNETMTVEELYNLSKGWEEYQEPVLAPVLVCCDGNLNHLNISDAHYLLHYSMPHLFSMFCKRFSVLNDNYASIFKENNENVKIKVILEESNVEQLPKIVNFVKRCTEQVPEFLNAICENVLHEKDLKKAERLVPICDSLLTLGECPDFWTCQERHAAFKDIDEPVDWMPRNGVITFKILHYHSPVHYSARLLTSTSNGNTKKFPQAYSTLSLKMGMYFSKETNKRLHGIPKVGDVCAVSVKQNFFVRCQVLKILTHYNNGTPNCVLIKLIDEEKLETSRDIYLFHLPAELKKIETHVVQVRLANVCPKDKDVTFSNLARDLLRKITNDEDLFIRGQVTLTVGNCIMVDTLEACQELTSLNETVVMHNLKKELLETHAIVNPNHMVKLEKLCEEFVVREIEKKPSLPVSKQNEKLKLQWAHLEDDMSSVYFASADNPGMFFVRLSKFESCMNLLLKDIAKYIESGPKPVETVAVSDVVLAKFPDDDTFERARIDSIVNDNVVKCFFVDQGDWRDVQIKDVVKIPNRFVTQIPFQAIECRLIGVAPAGDDWTEFGTNWFYDSCFDVNGDPKMLYAKYFTKEDAEHTNGRKYGVVLIDTSSDQDVVINQSMIDLNLAQEKEDEMAYLQELHLNDKVPDEVVSAGDISDDNYELTELPNISSPKHSNSLVPMNTIQNETPKPLDNVFLKQPIRSVPLVDSDNESTDSWDIVNAKELVALLKGVTSVNTNQQTNKAETHKCDKNNENPPTNENNTVAIKHIISDALKEKVQEPIKTPLVGFSKKQLTREEGIKEQENNTVKSTVNEKDMSNQLDSDDLSTTDDSQISGKIPDDTKPVEPITSSQKNALQPIDFNKVDELRKPKLLWRQNKTSVSIKILLIGSESYDLKLEERSLKFEAFCNDSKYGFNFELYGVVDDNVIHSDKGQYILVKLNKVLKKNWLTLTKDCGIRKWIVYDVDSIDTSSDEEECVQNDLAEVIKQMHDRDDDSDSDEDFLDDINYDYKRYD